MRIYSKTSSQKQLKVPVGHLLSKLRLVFASVLLLSFFAAPAQASLRVFACEPEWAALVKEIAPEAKLYVATTAYQDAHFVQARPSLIAQLRRADLMVCTGADLEIGWLPALQIKASNRKVQNGSSGAFYAAEQVELLDKLDYVDRTMGDVHPAGNPHVHFSPSRYAQIADALTQRLSQLDPEQAAAYEQRNANFQQRWQTAMQGWAERAAPLRGKSIVAYHSSYRYLFDWLGIEQVGDLEPKPGLPPSSGHLAQLLTQLKPKPPMAVVYTTYQDGKGADWLAQRLNVGAVQLAFSAETDTLDIFAVYDKVIGQLLDLQP